METDSRQIWDVSKIHDRAGRACFKDLIQGRAKEGGETYHFAPPPAFFWERYLDCFNRYKKLHAPPDRQYGGVGEIQSRFQLRTVDNGGLEVVKGTRWRIF